MPKVIAHPHDNAKQGGFREGGAPTLATKTVQIRVDECAAVSTQDITRRVPENVGCRPCPVEVLSAHERRASGCAQHNLLLHKDTHLSCAHEHPNRRDGQDPGHQLPHPVLSWRYETPTPLESTALSVVRLFGTTELLG